MADLGASCRERIADNEPHYRKGIAWYHAACYEQLKKKPARQ